jgi:hypothetical protein
LKLSCYALNPDHVERYFVVRRHVMADLEIIPVVDIISTSIATNDE